MNTYSIKDIEQLTGIKAHTLRIWEQRFDIIKPHRTETNIRYYDNKQLKLILNIAILYNNGLKISRIAELCEHEILQRANELEQPICGEDCLVKELLVAMVEYNEELFEVIYKKAILQYGFEKTMCNIIFPFIRNVGKLWMNDSVNAVDEHFISNLIRQKIITAINNLPKQSNPSKIALLFLPEKEHHELGILFAHYLFKKKNIKSIYLGASVPTNDLENISNKLFIDFVFVTCTVYPILDEVEGYVKKISTLFKKSKILVTGAVFNLHKFNKPKNVQQISTLEDTIAFIEKIV